MPDKLRIGKIYPAQNWVELHGTFNPMELRELAIQIEKNMKKVKDGSKN